MISKYLEKLINKEDLSMEESYNISSSIMKGELSEAQIASLLSLLRMKGETADEISGFAKAMLENANIIEINDKNSIDTCGTGGDGKNTFNVSTLTALIVASSGVTVSKHGNRSVSSNSGSADILEKLGVKIDLNPDEVKKCINSVGIGFMFAPKFHPSMRFVAKVRRELGIRTIFNVLGPLTNPARASVQLLGVYDKSIMKKMARVLVNLGAKRAMVICGQDGFDEITLTGKTDVIEVENGNLKTYTIDPIDFGFEYCKLEDIQSSGIDENERIIHSILNGEKGHKRNMALINSGTCLYLAGKVKSIDEGIELAKKLIDSKETQKKLDDFVSFTNGDING